MTLEIKTIGFSMRMLGKNMGTINCYLLKSEAGYLLIDTSFPNQHAALVSELEAGGCRPGNLKLIVITHADLDHVGNAASLRREFGAQIAVHQEEVSAVAGGSMTNRKEQPPFQRAVTQVVLKLIVSMTNFGDFEKFTPDLTLNDGYDLSAYGFDAKVIHLPGHSKGSIGVMTADGDLICGDLLWNMRKPGSHSIVDDQAEFQASLKKLESLNIRTVYPGHGEPFTMQQLQNSRKSSRSAGSN